MIFRKHRLERDGFPLIQNSFLPVFALGGPALLFSLSFSSLVADQAPGIPATGRLLLQLLSLLSGQRGTLGEYVLFLSLFLSFCFFFPSFFLKCVLLRNLKWNQIPLATITWQGAGWQVARAAQGPKGPQPGFSPETPSSIHPASTSTHLFSPLSLSCNQLTSTAQRCF